MNETDRDRERKKERERVRECELIIHLNSIKLTMELIQNFGVIYMNLRTIIVTRVPIYDRNNLQTTRWHRNRFIKTYDGYSCIVVSQKCHVQRRPPQLLVYCRRG